MELGKKFNLSKVERTNILFCQIFAVFFAAISFYLLYEYISLTIANPDMLDPGGFRLGRDFVNIYYSGNLLSESKQSVLFDQDAYHLGLKDWLGPHYSVHAWSYPPTLFLIAQPLSQLAYLPAYLIWTLSGAICIIWIMQRIGVGWYWGIILILSPAGASNLVAGQNGFFTAALCVLAIHAASRQQDITSAIAWAFLTIKPHLGLIALPMAIANKQWKIISYGVIIFSGFVFLTISIWGPDSWKGFFEITVPYQRSVVEEWKGAVLYLIPTIFMQGRLLGLSLPQTYLLHFAFSVIVVFIAIYSWPKNKENYRDCLTWFCLVTFSILPYSFVYDLVLFQIILAVWAKDPDQLLAIKVSFARLLWAILWLSPIITFFIVVYYSIQLMPFIFLIILWRRMVSKRLESVIQL